MTESKLIAEAVSKAMDEMRTEVNELKEELTNRFNKDQYDYTCGIIRGIRMAHDMLAERLEKMRE